MSARRKRRRESERRIAELSRRRSITVWTIVAVALIVLAFGIARIL